MTSRIAALLFCVAASLGLTHAPVLAGDADFEGGDNHDDGVPIFGEAKDIDGLKPMDGVRVRGQVKDASFPIIISTDAEGKFKFRGFGKDVNPDTVAITCTRDGYSLVDVTRRRVSSAADAPVSVECLMERKK